MVGADTTFLVELDLLEHPNHVRARAVLRREIFDAGQSLVIAPQVLAEFVHIVTDPRPVHEPAVDERGAGTGRVLVERRRSAPRVPKRRIDACLSGLDVGAPAGTEALAGYAAGRDPVDCRGSSNRYLKPR